MSKFFGLLGQGGPVAIVIILVIIAAIAGVVYFRIRRSKRSKPKQEARAKENTKAKPDDVTPQPKKTLRGTGKYPAMVIGKDFIDFTTIPEPIGEIYQFDTSCPMSGSGYIVKEIDNVTLMDYDPREISVVIEETPEYAWYATHWPVVKRVFNVPLQWWKSTAMWYAAGLMVIVFVSALVVLGGS